MSVKSISPSTLNYPSTKTVSISNKVKRTTTGTYCLFCVDDSLMIRRMLEKVFKNNEQLELFSFANGEDAIEQLDVYPEVVILDYHLSDHDQDVMNGLEILRNIREKSPLTKIIMLSSQNEISIAVDCLKKGASDYIIKDDVMSLSVEKSVSSIIKSIELKKEIHTLAEVIKRDKLLIKGYFFVIFALVVLVAFLLLR